MAKSNLREDATASLEPGGDLSDGPVSDVQNSSEQAQPIQADGAKADSNESDVTGQVSIDRVVDERVLTPLPGAEPAGKEDVRKLALWVKLRNAQPKPEDYTKRHDWERAERVETNWPTYRDMAERVLCEVSKDLELGIFLTEACTRIYGFVGVRDGLWTLRGLVTEFKDKGLYPRPENGDFESQIGKLDWLEDKFYETVREIPITRRPEPGINYDLNYRDESRRQNGMITSAEFEAAVAAGSYEQYEELLAEIREASRELDQLKTVAAEYYGPTASSFTQLRETMKDCRTAVEIILRKKETTSPPSQPPPLQPERVKTPGLLIHTGDEDPWAKCEELVRKGEINLALATMTSLAASEPNGRVRFHRKLMLADVCLQTNRKKLGVSILEELNEILELHKLETWETSELVGGVWSRLVHCYRDTVAGTANGDKEAAFFLKLSRLDPWQALVCGEPVRKE
jgi:type VI secretion system protein ImpA